MWRSALLSEGACTFVAEVTGVSLRRREISVVIICSGVSLGALNVLKVKLASWDIIMWVTFGGCWWSSWATLWEGSHALVDGVVYLLSNLIYLFFPIQVSADDVVCLNEWIKFSLQILVLLSQDDDMLLKSLVLALQVKVSVHKCLVWIVDGLEVSVLSSFINF